MKTFRDLKPDDVIIYKDFKVFEDCNDIINGVHYTQKVTLVDVNCVVECGTRYLQEIASDDHNELEKYVQLQIYNPLMGSTFIPNNVHQLIAIPVRDLDKSENEKFKVYQD